MAKGWLEALKEVGIALGVDVLFKKFTEKSAEKAAERAATHVFVDVRAELLEALRRMKPEHKRNLLRRHLEAMAQNRENRFAALLCKIPRDSAVDQTGELGPPGLKIGRRGTLKYLNDLSDEEFEQMLLLLEHDVVPQLLARMNQKIGAKIGPVVGGVNKAFNDLTAPLDEINPKLQALAEMAKRWAQRR